MAGWQLAEEEGGRMRRRRRRRRRRLDCYDRRRLDYDSPSPDTS